MTKAKMHTPNFTHANIARLAGLFPNCVTEVKDEQGVLKPVVDFDRLRQELFDHVVDGPRERYHLDWPGKREALVAANAPIARTLRPDQKASSQFDTTKNLFIEGDNLEALKLLQETYLNRVSFIYIDPPYNTGNQFIYDDDFAEEADVYMARSIQTDDQGVRLIANTEANGRRHSDWLSMLMPRLRLARNLLADNGVIFISIDDNEVGNLRKMCDEVFGEANFVNTIVWQKRYVSNVTARWLSDMHDFVLVYARQKENVAFTTWDRTEEQLEAYKNPDNDSRGVWRAQDLSASKPYQAGLFRITGPTGNVFDPPPNRYWRCNEKQFKDWLKDNRIWWGVNKDARPMLKSFLGESERGITPHTWWDYSFAGHNKEATLEVKALFDGNAPFDTPKPVRLMRRLLELMPVKEGIVLDFFAGSCTLAHAVMELNASDGGTRRHIMIQVPERVDEATEAYKAGYRTIADIGKERIRRAGRKIRQEAGLRAQNLDDGFRVLKIDSSNMKEVYYRPDVVTQSTLTGLVDNVKDDRTDDDLLFQVLLDWGVDLTLPIRVEKIDGKKTHFVDTDALAACFETGIGEAYIKELAKRKPLRVIFRDTGYGSDATKINVEQIFKLLSPATEVKSI